MGSERLDIDVFGLIMSSAHGGWVPVPADLCRKANGARRDLDCGGINYARGCDLVASWPIWVRYEGATVDSEMHVRPGTVKGDGWKHADGFDTGLRVIGSGEVDAEAIGKHCARSLGVRVGGILIEVERKETAVFCWKIQS